MNDINTVFSADLTADVTEPQLDVVLQNLVPIFCRPNEMISMVKNAMFAGRILHVLNTPKMNLHPAAVHFLSGRPGLDQGVDN